MSSIRAMVEEYPRMKALRDFLAADAHDSDRKWAEYIALAPDLAGSLNPKRGSVMESSTSSTTRSTASLRVLSSVVSPDESKRDATKDDLSPGARRIYDCLVGATDNFNEPATATSTPTSAQAIDASRSTAASIRAATSTRVPKADPLCSTPSLVHSSSTENPTPISTVAVSRARPGEENSPTRRASTTGPASTVSLHVPSSSAKDNLTPEARRIYDDLVGDSTSFAPAVPEVSTVLQDPTMLNVATIAVDVKATELSALMPITCSTECPNNDNSASVRAVISSATPSSSSTTGHAVLKLAADVACDHNALPVDVTYEVALPPTNCPTGHLGSDFGMAFLASVVAHPILSKPQPTAAATLSPAFTVEVQMSTSTSALATIGDLAAEVFWVRNTMISINPVHSEAFIVKESEKVLRPIPWPSFTCHSCRIYLQEPRSSTLQLEHMQQWRPPEGAYSWMCMTGSGKRACLFVEILVGVASWHVGVCCFLRTSDQEEQLVGCLVRRQCLVDLRPWPYPVLHFIQLCKNWSCGQQLGANRRPTFEEESSTNSMVILPRDTTQVRSWLGNIQFMRIAVLWHNVRKWELKGSEDCHLQSAIYGDIITYHAALTVLMGAAIVVDSNLLSVVRALRLDAAHKVFPAVLNVSTFVPWPPPSGTQAEPPLTHGQYSFHNAQQKHGKNILVVWVMQSPLPPILQDFQYIQEEWNTISLDMREDRQGIEVEKLKPPWRHLLGMPMNPSSSPSEFVVFLCTASVLRYMNRGNSVHEPKPPWSLLVTDKSNLVIAVESMHRIDTSWELFSSITAVNRCLRGALHILIRSVYILKGIYSRSTHYLEAHNLDANFAQLRTLTVVPAGRFCQRCAGKSYWLLGLYSSCDQFVSEAQDYFYNHHIVFFLDQVLFSHDYYVHLEYFDVGNQSRQAIPTAAPTYIILHGNQSSMKFGRRKLLWDPGIWALLCSYEFFAPAAVEGGIIVETLNYCYSHYTASFNQAPISDDYYTNSVQVHPDQDYDISHRYHHDPVHHPSQALQFPWDPGGLSRDRLEGKPIFKEGGLSTTILHFCWAGRVGLHSWAWLASKTLQSQEDTYRKERLGTNGQNGGFGRGAWLGEGCVCVLLLPPRSLPLPKCSSESKLVARIS